MFLVPDPEPDSEADSDSAGESLAWCQTAEGLAEAAAVDALNDRIGVLSAQIHALEAELVGTVAEFDTAEGWQGGGFRSMAHWLSIRTKFTVRDAHQITRVARRVEQIPTLMDSARDGQISLGVLDAAARVTTPENEQAVARLAVQCTPSQLSKVLSTYRDLKPTPDPDTDDDGEPESDPEYWWRLWEDHKGRGRLDAAMDATTTALMQAAWDAARAQHDKDRAAAGEDVDEPRNPSTNAIAEQLASTMIDSANRGGVRDRGGEKFLVQLHLDVETFADIMGLDFTGDRPFRLGSECFLPDTGRHLSDAEAARFLCEGKVQVLLHHNGVPLWLSHETRLFTRDQRRTMRFRSGGRGGCEFPGCTHDRYLDGHHVRFHVDGEPTTLDNGVFLCGYHHRTLHQEKWTVTLNGDQTYTFWRGDVCLGTTLRRTQPGGRAPDLMQLPDLTESPAAPAHITPDTAKSDTRGERLTRYALDIYLAELLTAG
jgi:hypothetical protein